MKSLQVILEEREEAEEEDGNNDNNEGGETRNNSKTQDALVYSLVRNFSNLASTLHFVSILIR